MARYARKLSKTSIYHAMIRGNERKNIFCATEDKERFMETLIKMKANDEYEIIAFCIMDNHAHLLIKELKDSIQRSMKRIEVSYTIYFNKKNNRVGHLFQDRYKSEPIETDQYILECTRYIHKNPVKAKMVNTAKEYIWSSFNNYMGNDEKYPGLVNTDMILGMFAQDAKKAIKAFTVFSDQSSDVKFVEAEEEDKEPQFILPTEVKNKIMKILADENLKVENLIGMKDKLLRNEILKRIKEESNFSVRDLAKYLKVSKDIIFRA